MKPLGVTKGPQQQAPVKIHGAGRNSMRFVRLLPLIVLFAFGAFISGQARPASATLNTFLLSTQTPGLGQPVIAAGQRLGEPSVVGHPAGKSEEINRGRR